MSGAETPDDVVREALHAGVTVAWTVNAGSDDMTALFKGAPQSVIDPLFDRYLAALERAGYEVAP